RQAVVPRILAHHHVRDRAFATHRAVLPVKPDGIKGAKVELVPGARLKVLVLGVLVSRQPILVGIGFGDLIDPRLVLRSPRTL
ncbi:hypothetical protein, partial [Rhizobium sp. Leaf384]|uniref:hypothetical protein n=1 Tax=Rhizobium sp. Leaf384 TaxID=1736358 RepID=UPI001AEC6A1E